MSHMSPAPSCGAVCSMRRVVIIVAIATLLDAGAALAQRPLEVTVGAGAAFVREGRPSSGSPGSYFQASVGAQVPRTILNVRAEATYAGLPRSADARDGAVLALGASTLLAPPVNRHPLKPYAIVGAGMYWQSVSGVRRHDFGVSGGAGVWLASGSMAFLLETRLHVVNGPEAVRYLPVVLGLRF
jgi:hypothetical protein